MKVQNICIRAKQKKHASGKCWHEMKGLINEQRKVEQNSVSIWPSKGNSEDNRLATDCIWDSTVVKVQRCLLLCLFWPL